MDDMMQNQILKINDLGLVSLLRYLGHTPTSIEQLDRKVIFRFSQTKDIDLIINAFELGEPMKIDVCRLLAIFKDTKGIVLRKMNTI